MRAGWTNVVGLDLDRGRTTRITRLLLDGRTDVTNNSTWVDNAVATILGLDNLPVIFMPGNENEQAGTPRALIVGDSADYWPNGPNPPNTQAEVEENPDAAEGMETADANGQAPAPGHENDQRPPVRAALSPSL